MVNHLGHYLLLRLLAPSLARNAIVVLTTSNTHYPKFSPVAPFAFVDAQELAHQDLGKGPRGDVAFESGFRAYATSKLYNLLTARAFANSTEVKARRLRIISYNPSYTNPHHLSRSISSVMDLIHLRRRIRTSRYLALGPITELSLQIPAQVQHRESTAPLQIGGE